jgi:hypothetical protein
MQTGMEARDRLFLDSVSKCDFKPPDLGLSDSMLTFIGDH